MTSYNFGYVEGKPNQPESIFSLSSPIDEFIHSYYVSTFSLLSAEDIRTIFIICQAGMTINFLSFTIGVATSQGDTYTVGIEDLTQVLNFSSTNFSNEASFTSLENYWNNL